MAIGKKKRFEVFKRDGFTCQYCGQKPPQAVLECDHIDPSSKGGSDEMDNLITSCFDCNRGKSNGDLDVAPAPIQVKAKMLKEQREQLKAYRQLKEDIEQEIATEAAIAAGYINLWLHRFNETKVSESFFHGSMKTFAKRGLSSRDLIKAWELSLSKFNLLEWDESDSVPNVERLLTYFCGVCWKMIKEEWS